MDAESSETRRETVVEFDNVSMIFKGRFNRTVTALDRLSLTVGKGEVVGLLGPNGCGKTTAISCMTGLLFPQEGRIRLWGAEGKTDGTLPHWKRIGVVLEDTRLPPFLTVKKALECVCGIRDIPSSGVGQEMERIIQATSISHLLDLKINVLSKGQARRVGVAAAMISDPPLLVLDEPASGMDVATRIEFNNLVRKLSDGTRTMMITSHLLSDVENTCTHIAIMQAGRIIVHDETRKLINSQDENETDIFVHERHLIGLTQLGLTHEACKYPRLLKLVDYSRPAHEILARLSEKGIAPMRIEPRSDLVRYYISVTENED
jgi:ABC-2 type transport system ATP-binding protein